MQFRSVKEIRCSDGISAAFGSVVTDFTGRSSVFMVSDPGISKAGLVNPVAASIIEAGHSFTLFDQVSPDPSEGQVMAAVKAAQEANASLIIGFGGGSAMDVAKLVAYLASSNDSLDACYGVEQISPRLSVPRLPLIQVPTTSGTGSEVTNISIVTTGDTTKKGIVDPVLYADLALLDPVLTLSLPRSQTAATAIDAMVHAIEAYTSKRLKNVQSDALALQALKLIGPSLPLVIDDPQSLDARRSILLGANLAGQAFTNAPVAAVHALAYPIGGHFHIAHGLSNSLVLPHVLAHNLKEGGDSVECLYGEIAQAVGLEKSARALCAWLIDLTKKTGIETRLRDVGIPQSAVPMLASEAMLQERLLINNPVPVSEADALAIYEAAW